MIVNISIVMVNGYIELNDALLSLNVEEILTCALWFLSRFQVVYS